MKVIIIEDFGGIDVFVFVEFEKLNVKFGYVVVKVVVISVNIIDMMI